MPRSTNYSLYSIPAAYIVAFIPHAYLQTSMVGAIGKWNNVSPRGNINRASSKLSDEVVARLSRAQAAHQNGLESLPVFGLAILAANLADVPIDTINNVSMLYIIARILYNPVYIFGQSARIAGLRTILWFLGQGSSVWLLQRAAARSAKSSRRLK